MNDLQPGDRVHVHRPLTNHDGRHGTVEDTGPMPHGTFLHQPAALVRYDDPPSRLPGAPALHWIPARFLIVEPVRDRHAEDDTPGEQT